MIRILIVDEHEADLERIRSVLSAETDFEIAGVCKEAYDSLNLASKLKPDLIILDVCRQANGAEFASLLKIRAPASSVILFTGQEHEDYIRKALVSRVSGYLVKPSDINKLAPAIRSVSGGGGYISPRITGKALKLFSSLIGDQPLREKTPPIPSFSRVEFSMMGFLAQGRTDKEIAEILRLKPGTVRNSVSSAIQKAGVKNRTQLAILAYKSGLAG